MRFKEIHFENFGPIKTGKISLNKINVFFGPNNSGKSFTSRFVHGINSIPFPSKVLSMSLVKEYQRSKKIGPHDLHLHTILHKSGIPIFDIVTHGANKCSIHVKYPRKLLDFTIGRAQSKKHVVINRILHFALQESANTYDSVYIPAGRIGTVQFFTSIVRIRNQLLRDLLHAFGSGRSLMPTKITTNDIRKFTRSVDSMPDYLEQFHNMILSSQTDGLDKNIRKWFSDLFPGSVELLENPWGLHSLVYKDPTGFITELESAGSGIVAAFPIIVGMHYVKPKGTLIVEEPEVHLEPSKQLKLLETLQDMAYSKNVNLIFTTHSDYVVRKLLALVSRQKIKHSDLNLYYFERIDGATTTIKHLKVDKNGESKQPTFEKAIDQLISEFSR